jgi:hypothetical protein
MRPRALAALLLALLSLHSSPAQNPTTDPAGPLPAGVKLEVEAYPLRATVGDPIRVDLRVAAPPGFEVQLPDPGRRIGDFDVLQFLPGPRLPGQEAEPAAAQESYHARIIVAVFRPGEFEFPPLKLIVRDRERREYAGTTPPLKIQIASVLTAEDQEMRDLKKQAEIAEAVRWWLWIGLLAVVLAFAGIWYRFIRRRKPPVAALAPEQQADPLESAEAELRELLRRGLLESGRIKPFYVAIADICKKFLEAGYRIQTVEKTTTEIMEALRETLPDLAQPSGLEGVREFLEACDLVKFAKYAPSRAEHETAVRLAWDILAECKRNRTSLPERSAAGAPGER